MKLLRIKISPDNRRAVDMLWKLTWNMVGENYILKNTKSESAESAVAVRKTFIIYIMMHFLLCEEQKKCPCPCYELIKSGLSTKTCIYTTHTHTLQIITTSSNIIREHVTTTQCISTPHSFRGKYLELPMSLLYINSTIRYQGPYAIRARQISSLDYV